MDKLMDQTVVFAFLLALALLIERLLEVLKSAFDYLDLRLGLEAYWTRRAHALQSELETALKSLDEGARQYVGALIRRYASQLIGEGDDGVITVSGDLLRATSVRFAAKVVAIAMGVAFCLHFQLDVITIWRNAWFAQLSPERLQIVKHGLSILPLSQHFGEALTGVVLGLGTGPLHKIITTIERQQKKGRAKKTGGGSAS